MEYTLIRSRRKTLSIEITPRGELLVRAPARMPRREIQYFLESRRDWITAHLAKLEPAPEPLSAAELQFLAAMAKETIPLEPQPLLRGWALPSDTSRSAPRKPAGAAALCRVT